MCEMPTKDVFLHRFILIIPQSIVGKAHQTRKDYIYSTLCVFGHRTSIHQSNRRNCLRMKCQRAEEMMWSISFRWAFTSNGMHPISCQIWYRWFCCGAPAIATAESHSRHLQILNAPHSCHMNKVHLEFHFVFNFGPLMEHNFAINSRINYTINLWRTARELLPTPATQTPVPCVLNHILIIFFISFCLFLLCRCASTTRMPELLPVKTWL